MSLRAVVISQLLAAFILAAGSFAVRGSELGTFVVLAASFGIGISVFHRLERREARSKRDGTTAA